MPDRPTAEEATQIEHELEMLRTRYVMMTRQGRVKSVFVRLASAVAVAAAVLYVFTIDIELGVYIIGFGAVAAGGRWIGRKTIHRREHDCTALSPSKYYPLVSFSRAWSFPKRKSAAEAILDMIALREKRLAGLKRASPP